MELLVDVLELCLDELAEASVVHHKTEARDADPLYVLGDLTNHAHLRREVFDKEATEGDLSRTVCSASFAIGFSLNMWRPCETKPAAMG